jgi:hypothetical protein
MNNHTVNLFLVLFTIIGFIQCLELTFWLMTVPNTFAFFGGIALFFGGFYVCYKVMINLLKSLFNKQ